MKTFLMSNSMYVGSELARLKSTKQINKSVHVYEAIAEVHASGKMSGFQTVCDMGPCNIIHTQCIDWQ